MNRTFFIACMLILSAFAVTAQNQNGLTLRNVNNHRSKFVREGSKIQLVKNHIKYKGTFKMISDQSILVNSDTIRISEIQELRILSASRQIGGVALLAPSSFIGGFGIYAIGAGLASADGYGIIAVLFGVPLAAVGTLGAIAGVKLLAKGKRYSPSDWEYRITRSPKVLITK